MIIKRPDWTKQKERNKSKVWIDKNENSDVSLGRVNLSNLRKLDINNIFAYPDLGKLYLLLSKHLKINYKNLLLTNGADGAIKLVFDSLKNKKNLKILRFEPSFAMYKIYSKVYSQKECVINYKKTENEPRLNHSEILKKIKIFKPHLILLANPNSPTGTILKKKELAEIIKVSKKINTLVLLDEAYFPYSNFSFINKVNLFENLIVVRSLKAFGLSGLRVGYLVANRKLIEIIGSLRPLYEINSVGAYLFFQLLKNYFKVKKSVQNLINSKNYFIRELKKRNIEYIKGFGNFTHIKLKKNKRLILNIISKKLYIRENESHRSLSGFSRISFTTKKNYQFILNAIDKFSHAKK